MTGRPRPLRILYLDHGGKPIGGGQFNTLSLIKALCRSEFVPLVVSSRENAFTASARSLGAEVSLVPYPDLLTGTYRNSLRFDPITLGRYALATLSLIWRLRKAILALRADIVHPLDNISRVAGGVAAWLLGVPAVCQITDDFEDTLTGRALRTIILSTMAVIMPVSDKVGNFFRVSAAAAKKVRKVYTGIDLDFFTRPANPVPRVPLRERFGIQPEDFLLAIVGNLVPVKGHEELFRALAILKEASPRRFKCLVVGDGPDRARLGALCDELRISDAVVFAGFSSDVPSFLREADLLVAPSRSEASSRVVLEAGALGIPSVGTRVGGIPEMIAEGETGLLSEPGDIHGLASAIQSFYDDERRAAMGAAARKRVETLFSNDTITRAIEDAYRFAVRQGRLD